MPVSPSNYQKILDFLGAIKQTVAGTDPTPFPLPPADNFNVKPLGPSYQAPPPPPSALQRLLQNPSSTVNPPLPGEQAIPLITDTPVQSGASEMYAPMAAPAPAVPSQQVTTTRPELPEGAADTGPMYDAAQATLQNAITTRNKAAEDSLKLQQDQFNKQVEIDKAYQTELGKLDEEHNKLMKLKPENFWAKAETSDKILVGLAVVLGGIGQGLSKSKENAALTALDHAIDQDLALQEKAIMRSQRSSEEKMRLVQARYLAANSQIETVLKSIMAKSQNDNVIASGQEKLAQLQADTAAKTDEYNAKFATTIKTEGTQAVSGKGASSSTAPAVFADVPAGKLTEAQAGDREFVMLHKDTLPELEKIEQTLTPKEFQALGEAARDIRSREKSEKIPFIGPVIGAVSVEAGNTPREVMERAVPGKGGRYFDKSYAFYTDYTREKSGAAISPMEYIIEDIKTGISPGMNKADLSTMINRRRQLIRSRRDSGQMNLRFAFEK